MFLPHKYIAFGFVSNVIVDMKISFVHTPHFTLSSVLHSRE